MSMTDNLLRAPLISQTFEKNDTIPQSLRGRDVYIKVVVTDDDNTNDVIHVKVCRDSYILAVKSSMSDIYIGETLRPITIPIDQTYFVRGKYDDVDIQVQLA